MSTVIPKKQPRGLWILSICELFGRFSYYGLQSSFILYLTKVFLFTDQRSYVLFGLFSALAFCFPILGGWIGDRYIGHQRAIVLGLMINVVGNMLLMFQNLHVFYLGVALFITGISLFKSNSATLLGRLYQEQDTRQEPGFTVLYAFMNIGSILGPICYGIVITQYGWHMGFLLGAIVEFISLILIFWNRHYFQKILVAIKRQAPNLQGGSPYLVLLLFITTMIIFAFLTFPSAFKLFFWLLTLCVLSFIIYLAFRLKSKARSAIFLLVLLEIFAIFYFACEIQVGSSLTLFIRCPPWKAKGRGG